MNRLGIIGFWLLFATANHSICASISPVNTAQAIYQSYIIDSLKDVYLIDAPLYFLEDSTGTLTITDIISSNKQNDFIPLTPENELKRKSPYWVKFTIESSNDFNHRFENWKLFLGSPTLASIYIVTKDGQILQEEYTGEWLPVKYKTLKLGNKVQRVNISFDLAGPRHFYIRLEKKDQHQEFLSLRLQRYDFMETHDYIMDSRRDWLFLGFMLTMAIFNFLVFGGTRYRAFLYHGLFILGVMIFTLDFFGVTADFIWIRNHPKLVQLVDYIGLAIMDIAYFQFVRSYLNLHSIFPKWDRIFKFFIYVKIFFFAGISCFYFTTYNEPLSDKIVAVFLASEYMFILTFMVPLFSLKDRKAYFLIAGTLLIFGGFLTNAISIINGQSLWALMIEIGLTGEIVCFSLGLAFRFKELRAEEEEAFRLKELNTFKSEVYSNITHEFRTPLTVILGVSDLSRKHLKSGSLNKLRESFDAIDRNSQALLDLINQMLDLNKLENHSMDLDLETKELVQFISKEVNLIQPMARKKDILLEFRTSEETCTVNIDEKKLHTVINNLLSNAIKFTPEKGRVVIHFNVMGDAHQLLAEIKITDTGYGIKPQNLPHIFDRFYQATPNPTSDNIGSGIGLALVKELVRLMNGEIKVSSHLGTGSSFTITIPVTVSEPDGVKKKSTQHVSPDKAQNIRTSQDVQVQDLPILLIVEDNAEIVSYLVKLLEADYKIITARDGVEGRDKALEQIPDIIISDIMMPRLDGLELCEELKTNEKTSHIPIILLTAKVDFEDRIKGLEKGADAYLAKPFKKEELFVRLQKLNELRSTLQEKYRQFALMDKPVLLKKENRFIYKVNSIIEDNLENEDFSVDDLASNLFLSRMQVHRKLKALTNRSASNYIRSFRLFKAKPLLEDAELTIADISWQVGFKDPNYFSKSFQKEFGMTPSDYRNTL